MRFRWLIWTILIIKLISCTVHSAGNHDEAFELYLLADDQAHGSVVIETTLAALKLAQTPLLTTSDLVSYERSTHTIKLTDAGYQKISDLLADNFQVGGIPFVIVSGSERIYAGAFWTPLSSQSFDGVVIMDPVFLMEDNTLQITLGYPSIDVFTGVDPRDDPRLMDALGAAGVAK